MAPDHPPRILFIPVSSPTGAGEYYRCLTLGQACLDRHPDWSLHICVDRNARVERPKTMQCHELDGSPTRDVAGTQRLIRALRPDLILFDSTLRQSLLREAQACNARTIFISSRPNRRRLGFGLRKLRWLDGHWLIAPPSDQKLGPWERTKLRLFPHRQVEFFSTLLPEPDPERRQRLLADTELPSEDYILVVPGGGGGKVAGHPVAEIFQQAAIRIHRQAGTPVLFIAGPLSDITLEQTPGLVQWRSVAPEVLSDLISGAKLVVSGGGSIVQQTLALARPCLAVQAAGQDQRERLNALSEQGVIATCAPEPDLMASTAVGLLAGPKRDQLISNGLGAGFGNDMGKAMTALDRLVRGQKQADATDGGP